MPRPWTCCTSPDPNLSYSGLTLWLCSLLTPPPNLPHPHRLQHRPSLTMLTSWLPLPSYASLTRYHPLDSPIPCLLVYPSPLSTPATGEHALKAQEVFIE